jgi:hypothetical protein
MLRIGAKAGCGIQIVTAAWIAGSSPAMTNTAEPEAKAGAAEGIRTPDPRITNAVLYRLSYRGGRMAVLIPGRY